MAASKVTLRYVNGEEHRLVLTTGDKLRAQKESRKPESVIDGTPDEVKQMLTIFAAFLAAKRAGLAGTDKDFLDWADEVAEVDVDITHAAIDDALAMGELTEAQAKALRNRVKDEEPGEAGATPA